MNLQPHISARITTEFRFIDKPLGIVFDLESSGAIGYWDIDILTADIPIDVISSFATQCELYRTYTRRSVPVLVWIKLTNEFNIL